MRRKVMHVEIRTGRNDLSIERDLVQGVDKPAKRMLDDVSCQTVSLGQAYLMFFRARCRLSCATRDTSDGPTHTRDHWDANATANGSDRCARTPHESH